MRFNFTFFTLLCAFEVVSSISITLPRDLKGAGGGGSGGGGGGRGGRGRSRGGGVNHSGGSSSSSGTYVPTGPARGRSGNTGHAAVVSSAATSRVANYFSPGGGQRFVLPSNSVFKGREMGGGARADVVGTRGYGSGYPYYQGDIRRNGVIGQPFPFGFWPIYWAGHGHSDEYGGNATVEAERPGGEQVFIQIVPTPSWTTQAIGEENRRLWMVGDRESVETILSLLADPTISYTYGCDVRIGNPQLFSGTSPQAPFHFENVVQWYRSSSFALVYQGYNNLYALSPLNDTTRIDWSESTPLPSIFKSSTFAQCINTTITAALPILDADRDVHSLSPGAIAGIVIGSIAGAILIIGLLVCCLVSSIRNAVSKKLKGLKGGNIKYTAVAAPKGGMAAVEKEPTSPPPPAFPLPAPYDPHNSEKVYRPPSSFPSAPASPRLNGHLSIPSHDRQSVYSNQTLVEDTVQSHGRSKI
ncbi:hypothetical protein M408DRAFT_296821 [Serendipita vermifera MAFF 305830]|uniref:Glycoside hydrolase family 16 protein n=1 Tax=Serendipita vermifera MAFF 305830 TaxID=933852 RepID=A0A0C3BDV7_SERVB|nr:hypothetical protein M408DRAFT_296821 [Serendipita vermifera MAFF 305830]